MAYLRYLYFNAYPSAHVGRRVANCEQLAISHQKVKLMKKQME
jgi:hypothetical protein